MPRVRDEQGRKRVARAFYATLTDEIRRRTGLSGRKVSEMVSPGNPTAISTAAAREQVPDLYAVIDYAKALDLQPAELMLRVERRLQESGQ